ncbi:MAG: hypothetical protein SVM86_05590 [Candidatus Cloacimonadota bacterium]|nr:hypothetical protein [Candidatus Cloacimonadota bacterium]
MVFSSCWRSVQLKHIIILLIFCIIGMPLGTHLLVVLPDNFLRVGIGFLILVFGTLQLLDLRKNSDKTAL